MKTLQVNSLPPKDVLSDLAQQFGTKVSQNCREYKIVIPDSWGSGYIIGTNFKRGLGIIQYHCTFNENIEIQFIVDTVHPLKFLYCIEGSMYHRFENDDNHHKLHQFQNSIVASQGTNGHILEFEKDLPTDLYSVEVNRKKFKSALSCELKKSESNLQLLFSDDLAIKSFYYQGLYCLRTSELFNQLNESAYETLINRIFLKGIVYQILARQIIQFDDDLIEEDDRQLLRTAEIKSVHEAVAIIALELDNLGSVQSIAQRVGLNANKLQDGFKILYENTVNGYIQKSRLDLARYLLLYTDESIQVIMEKTGLSSKSYFSKIFRDYYHISPSEFRKKNWTLQRNTTP